MINRINLLLKAKNITARQFAEEIGIQPSGMSHILGGRNNPSLEFVTKVIKRYPEIDANWLLIGRGEMYTSGTPTLFAPEQPTDEPHNEATLFNDNGESVQPYPADENVTPKENAPTDTAAEPSGYVPTYLAVPPDEPHNQSYRRLERLLFIYSDGTFEECLPADK